LFEGSITLLVPLQESVDAPEQRAKFPAVYQRVILGIICFYAVFGITCWMAFGDSVRTVLTTSLPDGVLATTVQLAYSLAVIFTFPLQNFPALEIATRTIILFTATRPACRGLGKSSLWTKHRRNIISSCLVALLAMVAVCTMDSLDKVVSLMGSLLGCPIAFVFPPLIHTRLFGENLSRRRRWGNRLVAGLGIVGMVLASTTTILTWNSK
jgi:proton-coupled amino acid transporter